MSKEEDDAIALQVKAALKAEGLDKPEKKEVKRAEGPAPKPVAKGVQDGPQGRA